MSNLPSNLTRNQLAEFLPNQRAVRAFEQLLKQVGDLLPSDIATINRMIEESNTQAASGVAAAQSALDLLSAIARSLDLLSKAPASQPFPVAQIDLSPPRRNPSLSELTDASVKAPVAGNILIYDATLRTWKSALLTAGTNLTIANADGAITINATSSATEIHAAASKTTPVDADEMPLADSASSFSLKKLTWANLKATLATWIGGNLIAGSFTSLVSSTTGKVATTLGVGNATPAGTGAGITFPASQSSSSDVNTLDDYEEGDWTPTLTRDVAPSLTYTAQIGKYVKIGRQVTLNGSLFFTVTSGGSGLIYINGFPFAANNTSSYSASGSVGYVDCVLLGADALYVGQNGTTGVVTLNGNFATGALSSGRIYFTITYQV